MKVLFISNLYPNSQDFTRATFNRQKIGQLKNLCEIVIVAPVAWFPFKGLFDKKISKIPFKETIDDLEIYHPRVLYIPKLFRFVYGQLYYLSIFSLVKNIYREFNFDLIFCSWVYPDGFAAMKLAKTVNKPFVVEALGSDINTYLKTFFRRRSIAKILHWATRIVVVSKDLKSKIMQLGVAGEKISVVYSGIDHELFSPIEQGLARRKLTVSQREKIILFVGSLVKIKGIHFLLEAVKMLKFCEWKLAIVGTGELEAVLKKKIKDLELNDKVMMIGSVPHNRIPLWMNACDVLCLPSLAEGVPNVILEAFACGKPVVASQVGGVGEVVVDDKLGSLVEPKDIQALADSLNYVFNKNWDQQYINKHSLNFSWGDSSTEIFRCLKACVT
jgi:glycosyltransferase involved in cell wall biosynthesis